MHYDSSGPASSKGTPRGSGSGGRRESAGSSALGANTAVLKGSFALSGCPNSVVDGNPAEFAAAVKAGLERVLAKDAGLREAVEVCVCVARVVIPSFSRFCCCGGGGVLFVQVCCPRGLVI